MGMRAPFQDVPFFLQLQLLKQFKIQAFKTDYIQTLQHRNERLADLVAYLKSDPLPPNHTIARSLLLTVNDYFLDHNILHHLWTPTARKKKGSFVQLVVPKRLQPQIMQAAHNDVLAGHLGVAKTYEVVRQRFYWLKMFQDNPTLLSIVCTVILLIIIYLLSLKFA